PSLPGTTAGPGAAIGMPPKLRTGAGSRSDNRVARRRPTDPAPAFDRRHLEQLAVLGDRAARHLQALADEEARDLRVGERIGGILGVDHPLDDAADRRRRAGAAARRRHLAREEVLELEDADR